MSKESDNAVRGISEICDRNERDIRRSVKERNRVFDEEEKFCRDNNLPHISYTRWKPKSSLPFLFYPLLRNLIQVAVLIVGYVVGFAILIWLIQSL